MNSLSVYALRRKNGDIFYIGLSSRVHIRAGEHRERLGFDIEHELVETGIKDRKIGLEREKFWIRHYLAAGKNLLNKSNTRVGEDISVRIDKDVVKEIKRFIIDNGGSIRSVLEHGAVWAMSKGAKEYLTKLKDLNKS